MRIAYFSNQFAQAKGHGVRRYAQDMFAAMRSLDESDLDLVPVAAWTDMDAAARRAARATSGLRILPTGQRATPLLWHFLGRPRLETLLPGGADITHLVSLGYKVATKKPLIVTIHDLGPLTQPQYFQNVNSRPWVFEAAMAQVVEDAACVVCVSQSTAREVIDFVGGDIASRVRVVLEGVGAEFFSDPGADVLARLNLPDAPLIMAAGKISPRKNVTAILEALETIAGEVPHHLVLTGGDGWEVAEVKARIAASPLETRVHLVGFLSEAELRALYHRAALYVHPSLYEGFGLTVLEAMAAGTPVITSNSSSLPEVAGGAACLVDPSDRDALARAMAEILSDPARAAEMTRAGRARARALTWEAAARDMVEIYREVGGLGLAQTTRAAPPLAGAAS